MDPRQRAPWLASDTSSTTTCDTGSKMQTLRSITTTCCTAIVVFLLLLAMPAPVAGLKRKVTFFQDPPVTDTEMMGSMRYYFYYATLRTVKGGPIVGTLHGQTAFNEDLNAAAHMETRSRALVFEFHPDPAVKKIAKKVPKGQVTAAGVVSYLNDSFFLELNKPVTVPVTGGSLGWYAATGQVTTVKLDANGEHSHTFDIRYINHKSKNA